MFKDDRSYYQHRAEVEIRQAQSAIAPSVIRAHQQLAQAYRGKLTEMPDKVEAS